MCHTDTPARVRTPVASWAAPEGERDHRQGGTDAFWRPYPGAAWTTTFEWTWGHVSPPSLASVGDRPKMHLPTSPREQCKDTSAFSKECPCKDIQSVSGQLA